MSEEAEQRPLNNEYVNIMNWHVRGSRTETNE